MDQLSPASANIIVLAVVILLYGLIWWASRNMSRFAKVLARLSPVGLVIPLVLYVGAMTAGLGSKQTTNKQAPAPAVQSSDKGMPALLKVTKEAEVGQKAQVEAKAEVEPKPEVEQKTEVEPKPEPSAGESAQ